MGFYTEEENKLLSGMDELLSIQPTAKTVAEFWEESISASVDAHYEGGTVKYVQVG